MAVRSEREKLKMQEKHQLILAQLLREEDNKSCVDCDAKSRKQNIELSIGRTLRLIS